MPSLNTPRLILASTSKYRRVLLDRLAVPYDAVPPDIDESPKPEEPPLDLVHRLSRQKAQKVAPRYPAGVIIGSDQIAVRGREVLGKPGTADRCIEQLRAASGQNVMFLTGVCILNGHTGSWESHVDTTVVKFRTLTDEQIRRYVAKDNPLDCAGGFKIESLGITLMERVDSQDPTALMGLPLIWVSAALNRSGIALP